ncbi:MAG: M1 family aminopeptidase [Balneolaceae bacterium]
MLLEIIKFEIQYRAKRAETYIYFTVLFLYSIIAVDFLFGHELGSVKANAPFVIAQSMTIISAFFMIVTSMIMGTAVLRDFDHNMESLIFINPIKKRDYLAGRFIGSFIVLLLIFSAMLLGLMLSCFVPWRELEELQVFNFWHYLQPFLSIVVPTLFFGGAIFFVTGALSRKLMVVYTQGIFFLMLYLVILQLSQNYDYRFLTALLDPFSFQTIGEVIQFWTPDDRNSFMISFEGVLLYNRLIWILIGFVALVIGYVKISFNVVQDKASKKLYQLKVSKENGLAKNTTKLSILVFSVEFNTRTSFFQIHRQALFHLKSLLKEGSFWAIVLCAMGTIFINTISLGTSFGVDSYPVTYLIVSELVELSVLFFLLIIIFYSGELVWKERDARLNQIHDSLPISDFVNLGGKFIGLCLGYLLLISFMILAAVLFQVSKGYYDFDFSLYFMEFFIGIFPVLVLLTGVTFFFQSLVNNKFVGHLAVGVFLFVGITVPVGLGYHHPLYIFGGSFLPAYSEMNGYGHFLESFFWVKIYWIAFTVLVFILATAMLVRGTETRFVTRLKQMKYKLSRPLINLALGVGCIFILSGSYIYYNTNVLNDFAFPSTQKAYRVDYEKTLKGFEKLPQPEIVDVNLTVDLFPDERRYAAKGYFILVNKTNSSINEVHIQKLPTSKVNLKYISFEGGATKDNNHEDFGYFINYLDQPIQPGDSIKMEFQQVFSEVGFEESSNKSIVTNGTFFDNSHFPSIGYNGDIELEDNSDREKYGLEPKARRAKIDDPISLRHGRADGDGEEIGFEMILGTVATQTALAPGSLVKEWKEGERSYFHYRMDQPIANFYSIVSAEYKTLEDKWIPETSSLFDHVDLEIYYQKGHEYNLDRMMNGMKKSFDYFSKNFGPYQYQQMRIMEYPRYRDFAQSFPNSVPFSESLGFILDIDDEKDVDMAFYITAHELAHQWWGLQVNPADVQGKSMISESLAQYSALMVLKKEYGEEKVQQFLRTQIRSYLRGRSREEIQEMPLSLVESGQEYIYYAKGAVNLYALQDYISEDSVNLALKKFIRDWDSTNGLLKKNTDRYSTTTDLFGYLREVTPDSLQNVISDLFETITIHENKAKTGSYEIISEENYRVNLTLEATKYQVDSLGVELAVGTNDWIDVGVFAEGEDGSEELIYLKKHHFVDGVLELEITVGQEPVRAGIDPLHKLIDRKLDDNIIELSKE